MNKEHLPIIGLLLLLISIVIGVSSRFPALQTARAQVNSPPDLSQLLSSFDNRVDLDNNGSWDSYWKNSLDSANKTCTLSLYSLSDKSLMWTVSIPTCISLPAPMFHWRSFIGSSAKDYTVVYQGPNGGLDYWLTAGDGSTGRLRNFNLFIGDMARPGVSRIRSMATIDFKLPNYPGPALVVRTNGGRTASAPNGTFYGRLFYFPANSNNSIELTKDPNVIKPNQPWASYPFPGADLPTSIGNFDALYNNFNPIPCQPNNIFNRCGVPDDGSGNGGFMGKLMVGDVDADGVEDLHTTYWSVHQTYPGRPKGSLDNLGAPMYSMWYNSQAGGMEGTCHANRHYGLSALTQTDADPYLEMVDVAGTLVNSFTDPLQNVSRNVALIDTKLNSQGHLVRSLSWNRPKHLTIPGYCPVGGDQMYKDAIHHPNHSLIQNSSGQTQYIQFSRWTQLTQPENCGHNDLNCYKRVMAGMTGYWSWELLNAQTGATAKSFRNTYLWGVVPGPDPTKLWVLYSRDANTWNLGFTDLGGTIPLLRDDLTLALLDTINPQLPLTNVQNLPSQMRPFLKLFHWQNIGSKYAANTWGLKLFTVPDTASAPERFVVRNASGMTLYAFRNDTWSTQYQYDGSGRPFSPTPTPTGSPATTPTPTPTLKPTPTPTPSPAIPTGSPTPTPTSSPHPLLGDIDGSRKVDILDYNLLVTDFGKTTSSPADLNGNGKVDIFDYNILVENFGKSL